MFLRFAFAPETTPCVLEIEEKKADGGAATMRRMSNVLELNGYLPFEFFVQHSAKGDEVKELRVIGGAKGIV